MPTWTPSQLEAGRAFVDVWRQQGLDVDLATLTYPGEYRYVPEYLASTAGGRPSGTSSRCSTAMGLANGGAAAPTTRRSSRDTSQRPGGIREFGRNVRPGVRHLGDARSQLRFVAATHDDALAQPLLAELAVEYAERYGGTPDAHLSLVAGAGRRVGRARTAACSSACWTACRSPAGHFGVSTPTPPNSSGSGPTARIGAAVTRRTLLAALEAETAARGYRRLYLITGNRQPEAEALYDATGYTRVAEPLPAWGPFLPIAFEKGSRMTDQLHLGVALDGYGWHPQAWRPRWRPTRHPVGAQRSVLGRAGRDRRARTARLSHHRRHVDAATRSPRADRSATAGRPRRRRSGRGPHRAGDAATSG